MIIILFLARHVTLVVIDLRIIYTFFLHSPTYQHASNTLVADISPDIFNIRNNSHAEALLTSKHILSTEANQEIF